MPNITVSLRKIINFASVGALCLATFEGNHAHCSSFEEFGIPDGTNSLELITAVPSVGTFRPTTQLEVQVCLPADADIGHTYEVNTSVTDSLANRHHLLLTYAKTPTPLEWDITLTAGDAVPGGIRQTSGANKGCAYSSVTVQFAADGLLLSYNGVPEETIPPTVCIDWATTSVNKSAFALNFGAAGTPDAMRITDTPGMGILGKTEKNSDDSRLPCETESFAFRNVDS